MASPPPPLSSSSLCLSSYLFLILCLVGVSSASSSAVPTKIGKGYRLVSVEQTPDGGLLGLLQVNKKTSVYGPDIPLLQFFVKHETASRLRVHITDAEKQRWEVPYNLLPRGQPPPPLKKAALWRAARKDTVPNPVTASEYAGAELIFSFTADPFSFAVRRKSNGETLFNTSSGGSDPYSNLVFKDQYLEVSTALPKDAALYGLGENTQPHGIKLFPGDPYTLYTTDVSAINLNTDLYGSHPVYMDLRNVGGEASAHAVLLLNSNGMDVFYRGTSLTYKVIGGVMDFYFFAGPSPLEVVDQYTQLIGRPAPMPYWSFGFHQCRWGYHNLSVVEDVVENYQKARIPLDVIWNDDDHMDGHKDFTLNPTNYPRPKLLAFLDKIHSRGMKYIVIIDPGIGINSTYGVYQRGIANDVFIKYDGVPYVAQVWPGAVNFPDFLNPKTVEWWGDEIRRFHELVPVDGLWIDMNEASNFCSGKCTIPKNKQCPSGTGPGWICCLDCKNITKTRWDDPPYKINASGMQVPIGFKTIATSAVHYNGVLEYDAHSIYGFSQSVATHKALEGLEGKRPFILSRSTFVGSGKYAAHWTGDNKGTWEDLKYSISTMLNFGIFGVPMVGSDICGFYPAPTEELCNRWIEVGAFYPFSRDHANYYSPRQELYQWESVAQSARNALGMRYRLLPYLYTLSYEAHTTGAPIARPVFFSFPTYTESYGVSTQFLLGSSVMVSPVLEQGKSEVKALFPPGSWYSLFDMTQAITSKSGKYVTLDAPLHVVNVHVHESTILPMQQGGMISKEARETPFSLVVTFPAGAGDTQAKGSLFLDKDELPEMKLGSGYSSYVEFYATVGESVMIGAGAKLLRAATAVSRVGRVATTRRSTSLLFSTSTARFFHRDIPNANPVAVQMIDYAISHARSQKSDDSYSQGLLVLEQCLSNQLSEGRDAENSRGLVLLAMSTLLSERGNFDEAMEKLRTIEDLRNSSMGVRVAAFEALVGLNLERGQDDASSALADKFLELLSEEPIESIGAGSMINSRVKAVKGLVELVRGDLDSAGFYFQGSDGDKYSTGRVALLDGNVALSYGLFLHSTMNFSLAKEVYQKVIQGTSENKGLAETHLAACNMILEEVVLGATCALGQLESHMGNFSDAEEILTKALTKTEEHFGSYHPKVGIVLTCIALMFRWKAMQERSSSLLVQEGLFRKATDLLKAPALDSEGADTMFSRRDIAALARGGYAEALCVQQNRKAEGDKLKSWSESAWRNRRLSLSDALDWQGPSTFLPIIDFQISRVL